MEYDNNKLEVWWLILHIILRVCGNLLIYILVIHQFLKTSEMEECIEI